jgi:DnaJ-domain-containing protein 1
MSIYDLGAIMVCGVVGYFIVSKIITIKRRDTKAETDKWSGNKNKADNQSKSTEQNVKTDDIENRWHKILGVSSVATIGEIKAAYQRLMSQYHPDKVATLGTEIREVAERRTKEINAAYQYIVAKYGEHYFKE